MITTINHATPEWITQRLVESGVLERGKVVSVKVVDNETGNSRAAHLLLKYSEATGAPERVFLKLKDDHNGELEVKFYEMSEARQLPMLVRCLGAEYDPESGHSYCLLEDFSKTHRPPVSREAILCGNGVPAAADLENIVDVVAEFHAFWWNHSNLGRGKGPFEIRHWFRDEDHYRALVTKREKQYAGFLEGEAAAFPTALRQVYDTAVKQLPGFWEKYLRHRIMERSKITLTHGDCYFSQFLVGRAPVSRPAYMVDLDSVSGNFGAYDLAYLFPTFWTSAQRQEGGREVRMLERYHRGLMSHGVRDYSREELMTDYRLMVAQMLFDPFLDYHPERRGYWWPKMQCLAAAYEDLNCAALLEV